MTSWVLLDSVLIPGGTVLNLHQRGGEFSIRVGNAELMNSGANGSERALADLGFDRLARRSGASVLIGGLGMGFTAAAALRRLDSEGRITVAELVPAVVTWNRTRLAHLAGDPLADARIDVHVGDVADLLRERLSKYDLILLDVDNGPQATTAHANGWLYTPAGLVASYRALRPGGLLTIWSATRDEPFTQRLRQVGFIATCVEVRAHGSRGRRHWIWVAERATKARRDAHRQAKARPRR